MAIELKNKPNVPSPNSEYPYSRIRDNDGSNNGTPINTEVYGDMHQFFARMFEKVKELYPTFDYNDEPDNAYDGFQYYEALLRTRPYKVYMANVTQAGSAAPVMTVMTDQNTIGTIVWTRTLAGLYTGTLSGAFPANKTWCLISACGTGFVQLSRNDNNTVTLVTKDTGGTLDDDILDTISIEIRVYP